MAEGSHVRCFEVDTPQTQRVKRDTLRRAGIDSTAAPFAPSMLAGRSLTASGYSPQNRYIGR
ncbi:MAG: class I SAM-dependent methyltransferase [Deltaproteobacteria bacterium]|nr:class I SAM-dependent methyltransferase [Deltaproteobacteria bacterium]